MIVPSSDMNQPKPRLISLEYGWFVSLLGIAAIILGGAIRAGGTERPRKPPGVL